MVRLADYERLAGRLAGVDVEPRIRTCPLSLQNAQLFDITTQAFIVYVPGAMRVDFDLSSKNDKLHCIHSVRTISEL